MRAFLTLLIGGILLSIVGGSVDGFLWLTVPGILAFLGAVAYAVLASRPPERNVTSQNNVDSSTSREEDAVDASSVNGDAHPPRGCVGRARGEQGGEGDPVGVDRRCEARAR